MLAEAIARYGELLGQGTLAADSHDHLTRLQGDHGLYFGTRPVCTVLRPRFVTPAQYRFLHDRVNKLLPAFQIVHDRALGDPTFRRQLRLFDWEEELLAIDPGYPSAAPTSRLDCFFSDDQSLWFTEYNTETPAGAGYTDALTDVFLSLPVMQEFQRHYLTWSVPNRPGVLHALLDSYRRWRGNRNDPPRIAILDWREVPTFSEFVLLYDYFHSMGVEVRNVDPREVEYVDGRLMTGDYHITLIYKRVLLSELYQQGGLDHPVIRAAREGAVCLVNSFRCKILFKKASLAVLSDEHNQSLFDASAQEVIASHIPWTRVVEDRRTVYQGNSVDLLPFIRDHREHLVLKPNDEYGGRGIVLGWRATPEEWEATIALALREPHVVQDRIRLPFESYPSWEDGRLAFADRVLDTDPYVAFGSYMHGCLTRLSTDELVNVSAGGGSAVPTFVIEPR